MPNIQVLDQNTINQIAAGEVIERPASVVKELLENAIDARATAVTVEIRDGGTTLIRVTDNGCGIEMDQIPVAFLRHSTSKIRSVEDLLTVSSLGFRGEALSSIAAVSQMELITKTADQLTGARYVIEGSKEVSLEEIGAPDGTTFLVRNLFFNTPARRKFLKSPAAEASYISDLVEKIALSHPDVSIRFINNNQNKLHTVGNHNLKDIIYNIFGRDTSFHMIPVHSESEVLTMTGYLGQPVLARGNRAYEIYFINGRYIKSSIVGRAIEEAYKPFMMQHKYPFTVLHFSIDSQHLDVNVHPTKMELRFRNSEEIYSLIFRAVSEALRQKEMIPDFTVGPEENPQKSEISKDRMPEPFERNRSRQYPVKESVVANPPAHDSAVRESPVQESPVRERSVQKMPVQETPVRREAYLRPAGQGSDAGQLCREKTESASVACVVRDPSGAYEAPLVPIEKPEQLNLFKEEIVQERPESKYRLIGQIFDTYWLIQQEDRFLIVDQHAAHEKVMYERLLKAQKQKEILSQQCNPPIILTLNLSEQTLLCQHQEVFRELGFEIEPFGGKEYAVYAVPANLPGIAGRELMMELIGSLGTESASKTSQIMLEKLASMSCKAAVKGNQKISREEMESLLLQMMELDNPYACPHGRPTMISMTKYELEKKFKRVL